MAKQPRALHTGAMPSKALVPRRERGQLGNTGQCLPVARLCQRHNQPNIGLQATAYSLRSCVASAIGGA
jgi:hypothetical protein